MRRLTRLTLAATAAVLCALTATGLAQRGAMTPEIAERRWDLEKELRRSPSSSAR